MHSFKTKNVWKKSCAISLIVHIIILPIMAFTFLQISTVKAKPDEVFMELNLDADNSIDEAAAGEEGAAGGSDSADSDSADDASSDESSSNSNDDNSEDEPTTDTDTSETDETDDTTQETENEPEEQPTEAVADVPTDTVQEVSEKVTAPPKPAKPQAQAVKKPAKNKPAVAKQKHDGGKKAAKADNKGKGKGNGNGNYGNKGKGQGDGHNGHGNGQGVGNGNGKGLKGNGNGGGGNGQGQKPPKDRSKGPRILFAAKPDYPEEAKKAHISGIVVLNVRILADGSVGDVSIASSSGNAQLDAALDAGRRSRFAPAKNFYGESIPVNTQLPVRFDYHDL